MTAIIRPAETAPGLPDQVRRRVTGTPSEVAATVAMVRDSGHLVTATAPRQLYANDTRVTVLVTLRRQPIAAALRARPSRTRQLVKPLSIAAVTLGVLVGAGFGVSYLVGQTVRAAAAASPMILGILAVVALVLVLAGKRRISCSGLHCGGCQSH